MGSIFEKIDYTVKAVNEISKALREKGFNIDPIELKRYPDLIRELGSGGGLLEGYYGGVKGISMISSDLKINKPTLEFKQINLYSTTIFSKAIDLTIGIALGKPDIIFVDYNKIEEE